MIRSFLALGLSLLMLAACVKQPPLLGTVDLPPPASGAARLYIYREAQVNTSVVSTKVYLNGKAIGVSYPHSVFYKDVPPGQYRITTDSRETYPDQFKTILVQVGERRFIRIEPIAGISHTFEFQPDPGDTFFVNLMNSQQGAKEAAEHWFYGGGPL